MASLKPFGHVTVVDATTGQTETVSVTPSATAIGVLSDPNASTDGGSVTNGVYTVSGTTAQVTAALDGLVFTPTAHQVPPSHTVTTNFTIQATDGAGQTASDSTTKRRRHGGRGWADDHGSGGPSGGKFARRRR